MTIDQEVQVLSRPDRRDRSEAQDRDREETAERSAERRRGSTNRNGYRGASEQDERANDREVQGDQGDDA
jgi:hypothetical protein